MFKIQESGRKTFFCSFTGIKMPAFNWHIRNKQ